MSTKPIRHVTDLFELLNRGRFLEKADEHLAKAIEALEELPEQKGVAKINIELSLSYVEGRLDVKPSVKSKLPEEKGFSGTPFWTIDGALSVQHPSQADMFPGPREVPPRKSETA